MNLKLEKIYKNWAIHNFVGHPLMQLFYMINMNQAAKNIHDKTIPVIKEKNKTEHINIDDKE